MTLTAWVCTTPGTLGPHRLHGHQVSQEYLNLLTVGKAKLAVELVCVLELFMYPHSSNSLFGEKVQNMFGTHLSHYSSIKSSNLYELTSLRPLWEARNPPQSANAPSIMALF